MRRVLRVATRITESRRCSSLSFFYWLQYYELPICGRFMEILQMGTPKPIAHWITAVGSPLRNALLTPPNTIQIGRSSCKIRPKSKILNCYVLHCTTITTRLFLRGLEKKNNLPSLFRTPPPVDPAAVSEAPGVGPSTGPVLAWLPQSGLPGSSNVAGNGKLPISFDDFPTNLQL